ncbi:Cbb3-type cytochrome oxidase, subunit 1 [Schinkia azotoformans MEV2011]|uniref:Cbb3-type cytochrome oxidase, subunit 1 n=1 Tax=Schinkia azotoformans MEV2011 TaxID=1348973 RepID=A0A072NKW9_SCHAZ|nr:cbb3-type cytochrome c oxidase subunit I [Schinkia azotoformans]KEF38081.1 Cbb3-type cytochrome oxidase, subunit 1 [Schinkia azotoformans MEV2011]MEC1696642.1 cbb3-type cytochrome c oxidase subunit I [Schinkia azotoformans]MEC1726116.1 cbb3-type cytochrome c oxidase subunit I [Schinkia azotoformans]MEC1781097.1 cbb3-type cytochrome c oxidase subunit I [Schinkia azotoformans]MED4329274.1 cbb3-type cytochrome c oxidase subunit I [Schinkia azotoformans]
MGVADLFQFTSAHAHINLIGWVSLAITGVIYHIFPVAGESKLAKIHFWLMMIGVPLLAFSMILFGLGQFGIGGPISGIGGIFIFIGAILFMINIMKNVKEKVITL